MTRTDYAYLSSYIAKTAKQYDDMRGRITKLLEGHGYFYLAHVWDRWTKLFWNWSYHKSGPKQIDDNVAQYTVLQGTFREEPLLLPETLPASTRSSLISQQQALMTNGSSSNQ